MSEPIRRYFDNAATSFPKPEPVHEAMARFARHVGASPGRGHYRESQQAGDLLAETRRRLCRLIGADEQRPEQVIFTLNCTDALNLAIKGAVRPGDHAITTELDHNSILRPFNKLEAEGVIEQTRLRCDPETGHADPDELRKAIRPDTRLVAMLHGSNVTGTVQDIEAFGRIAHEHDALLAVDAAQTIGHTPIDVARMHIDLLAAPGHKGLLGPLGTGFLYIRPGVEKQMTTLREGGTGSVSERDTQPEFLPDRFEAGSHNTIGLVGLSEGVRWILDHGPKTLHEHERRLTAAFLEAIEQRETPGLHLYGPKTVEGRCAVFSFRIDGIDQPADVSYMLERDHGVLTRSGLHCAPGAHVLLGTHENGGTTRLSFGPFLSEDDVVHAAEAVSSLCRSRAATGV